MAWPKQTVNGVEYYVFMGRILLPVGIDPTGEIAQMLLYPEGGMGVGVPAIEKGDKGDSPKLRNIAVTELAWNSSTPMSATFSETGQNTGIYDLALSIKRGAPGATGSTVLSPSNFTGAGPNKILQINDAGTAFELISPRVGDRYVPAEVKSTPSGNPGYTVAIVSVPVQNFDWRPECLGACLITPTGTDFRGDFLARLGVGANAETAGAILTRGFGVSGAAVHPAPTILSGALPSGPGFSNGLINDAYDRVAAGAGPTPIYFRVERRTGGQTFTTLNTSTDVGVRVHPIR